MRPIPPGGEAQAPSECTLPTEERPRRVAEFDDFFEDDVARLTRPAATTLSLDLRPGPEVAARAAGLAARESGCCSFFTFRLTVTNGSAALTISTPDSHAAVIDALSGRAEARR